MIKDERLKRNRNTGATGFYAFHQFNEKKAFLVVCLIALIASSLISFFSIQETLHTTCAGVAEDFNSIMTSYEHSFGLLEKFLQLEIATAKDADAIEAFLKEQDASLLAIEGNEYDGVYLYHQGRYLYSWSTPFSVYANSGYDATKRPWYIGAVAAKGDIFFSVPYPSYANDYMLATISRLQPDKETVIAYDIKLGEIGHYVDKLDIYNGSLTLICDAAGNIIGSTERLYQGGNYLLSDDALEQNARSAQQELHAASDESAKTKAQKKVQSAQAQRAFISANRGVLARLSANERTLHLNLRSFSLGYAYSFADYTCFVILPITHCLLNIAVLWAALSFALILAAMLIAKMLRRSNQILTDALTGLNNRRALVKYCNDHVMHHPENELCLIMLDLNDFKKINDEYGHVAGDHALLDAAEALKKTCAEAPCGFFLCRYGGDEFLLAGSNCSSEDIDQTIALIRSNLHAKNESSNEPYTLEISSGVARGKGTDNKNIEKLLSQADDAMYRDKLRMKQDR